MTRHTWSVLTAILAVLGMSWWTAYAVGEWRFRQGSSRARQELSAGRFDAVREWLTGLSTARTSQPEVLDLRAVCEHAGGNYRAALDAWSKIPRDSPLWPAAALARAQTLVGNLGRFSEAEQILLDAASVRSSTQVDIRHALSQLYLWEFRPEAMRRVILDGRGVWRDPGSELRDLWLIDDATIILDDVRDAIAAAERLSPDDDRVWLARAGLETADGYFDAAAQWLNRCDKRRPDDPAVWLARLKLARLRKDTTGALAAIESLPGEFLFEHEILDLAAWLAARQNNAEAERTILERRVRTGPVDLLAYDRLAVLDLEAGRRSQAAELRREKGRLDLAKDRYRRLLQEQAPASRFAELGELAETLRRPVEADGWWRLAYRQHPGDPTASAALERLASAIPHGTPHVANVRLADRLATLLPDFARARRDEKKLSLADSQSKSTVLFIDDAADAGLSFVFQNGRSRERQLPETTAGGVGLLDYDGDGWLDVYVVQGGIFPPNKVHPSTGDRLFHNQQNGQFEDATNASGINRLTGGYGLGVTVGDYDNDGHPDLFLTRWGTYQLLHNKGNGTFEDATERAGLGGPRNWPTSAAFADLDNDGDLDLYVCHYLVWDAAHPTLCDRSNKTSMPPGSDSPYDYCMPNPFPAEPDHLFRNDGGRFVDVSAEAGIIDTNGRGLGVVAADLDEDGLVDLFVANDTSANYLWHNLGNLKFEETGITAGIACNAAGAFQAGMGTAVGDLDGDGRPDLFVTNFYGESTSYFQNMGHSLFADRTAAIGLAAASRYLLGFGIVLFDANNDGYLDLSTANGHVIDQRPTTPVEMPALLMLGAPGGQLTDVSSTAGAPFQSRSVGRALAAGDLDRDGRVDLIAVPQNSPLVYFHNRSSNANAVGLLLEGTKSNRDAIGAVVTLTAGGRARRAWRSGGGSFQSASGPILHFGPGDAKVERVEVRWPSGRVEQVEGVEAGGVYRVREGMPPAILMRKQSSDRGQL